MLTLPKHQLQLILAAFGNATTATAELEKWSASVDLDDVDFVSQRSLSQVYLNCRDSQIVVGRIQGLYRRAWVSGTLLISKLEELVRQATALDLNLVATGQTASVLMNPGCYPIDRIHISCSENEFEAICELLSGAGWHMTGDTNQLEHQLRAATTGIDWSLDDAHLIIQVVGLDNVLFWNHLTRAKKQTFECDIPGHAFRLMDAAAPQHRWEHLETFYRVFTTLLVIREIPGEQNWSEILAQLSALKIEDGRRPALMEVLELIGANVEVSMPQNFVYKLGCEVKDVEVTEHKLRSSTFSSTALLHKIRLICFDFHGAKNALATMGEPLSLNQFITYRWRTTVGIRGVIARLFEWLH